MVGTAGAERRIVVAVDDSVGGRTALRWAADEAALRGVPLHAVHAWSLSMLMASPGVAEIIDPAEEDAFARRLLAQVVDEELGGRTIAETVNQVVRRGNAAHVLIEVSEGADMLVVGSRERHGFSGALLGSVSDQCVHHAHCPVVVVRPVRIPPPAKSEGTGPRA